MHLLSALEEKKKQRFELDAEIVALEKKVEAYESMPEDQKLVGLDIFLESCNIFI